ncbi:hypothetical protein AVEN_39521-1 [Araneus ventricosus]|uniref:Uncharacterized protein n=1 Tax=Araneus ventricosus TaxID=182803 RepID=A0A4Y2NIU3_ARAVE|nr:hypothetical protein AVEN_39521-1 [Araneus ventricosus]
MGTKKIYQTKEPRQLNDLVRGKLIFSELITVTMPQEQFLSNDWNKEMYTAMLSVKLESEGFLVKQAKKGAEVRERRRERHRSPHHAYSIKTSPSAIFFLKPGKGNSPNNPFSASNFKYSQCVKNALLFLHAFSGCDTTTSFCRQGRKKFLKLILRNEALLQITQFCMSKEAQMDSTVDAERRLMVALYRGKVYDALNGLGFQLFSKSLMKGNLILASLHPRLEAVRQNCLRTYLQALMWLDQVLNSLNWG